jgi:hypothetical protein
MTLINFPNLEEFLLAVVAALPNTSNIGFAHNISSNKSNNTIKLMKLIKNNAKETLIV